MSPADLDLLLRLLLWMLAVLIFGVATVCLGRLLIRCIERSCPCACHLTRSRQLPIHEEQSP